MSLDAYNKKRVFSKTPEPKGKEARKKKAGPLRFVVQKHDASQLHYDFRLELDGVLKSWAVPKGPSMDPQDKRLAMMTEDHPMSYASFEGAIPKGAYGAGEVIVWDEGVYMSSETANEEESRKKIKSGMYTGEIKFILLGKKLKGEFVLVKMKGKEDNAWLLIKHNDEFATKKDILEDTSSVISGKTLGRDTVEKKQGKKAAAGSKKADPMPHNIKPMLAHLFDEPFNKKGWIFEIKWDGYRAIAEIEKGKVAVYSRNGKSFTKKYPPITKALSSISHDCVIDGEIIATADGKMSFAALQQYDQRKAPLQYAAFDLLYLDGTDLRDMPLRERKKLLQALLKDEEDILYSDHIEDDGKSFFKTVKKKQLEGMVAKDGTSPYRTGVRSKEWLKIKTSFEQEAVIIGFTKPRGSRKHIGALVLAVYIHKKLTYIGHSGGGFTDAHKKELYEKLKKITVRKPPVDEKVPINSPITWVKPEYVCQVKFSEWTKSGKMRHPIYQGLRTDKSPKEVFKEEPVSDAPAQKPAEELVFTHREKMYFPEEGYTKGDVIDYYDKIADILLPYLKDRPQNLNRHPNGITGNNFFQKNVEMELPSFVHTQEIWSESNEDHINYIVCQNKETLLYLANLGCIEINPWNSRIGSLDHPDYMILDLDPNGRPFEDLIRVALEIKKVLDMACQSHYPKTSGKTGIHVLIPLNARYSYDHTRRFAELIMEIVHARLPDMTSIERSPAKRKGKIYLDYLQNRFGQTLACAYSLRPYADATVSTPLQWSEVRKGLDPQKFTIKTIWKRIKKKGDLWKPMLGEGTDLNDAIRCLEEHSAAD